ncbi:hypothetical protein GGX14DRAFT_581209 [Mycena pura]|uniref:Nephrocystin 3-like N-terminal domain-containing protein n=1 Tax=Mycena pura TaxID=153505 RepID=A0AAD6XV70_9AGAR|nr:hypothetical protein GGX14DRAFT_581209 [Mycena pura]
MPSYSLLVQSADGISWKPGPLHRKDPKFYVAISVDKTRIHRTHSVEGKPGPKWNTVNLDLIGLATANPKSIGNLAVRLMNTRDGAALAIKEVQRGTAGIGPGVTIKAFGAAGDSLTTGDGVLNQISPVATTIATALESVTSKLDIIVKLGDQIATIHPYANIAWSVLTAVYKVVKQQESADAKLLGLIVTMNEVYSFVGDMDFLVDKIKSVEDKALAIVKQTVECALFIQEYAAHGFTSRAIRGTWDDMANQIDKLSTTMQDMKRSFEGDLTVQCVFISAKVFDVVERLDESDMLKRLNPVDMNASSRPLCLPGTRGEILNDITAWATVPSDAGNVLWLSGVAGSGKSTVSTTIAESLRGVERLGAFLFFDRNDRARSHPDAVIRTLAYWLALSNPHIASAVSAAIRQDSAVVNAPLPTQFQCLLLGPLKAAEEHIQGPLIVILDALDECGDNDSRLPLLRLLSEELPQLPSFLRVFITSRRDSDITECFGTTFAQRFLETGSSSSNDVEAFIRHELTLISGLPSPEEMQIQALLNLSGGLFIWASTAMKYLRTYRPKERLRILLAQDSTRGFNLDSLYSVALGDSAPWKTEDFAQDARSVLICVVLGRVPMTDTTIDAILSLEEGTSADILTRLGCVIQWSPGNEARTLHASFADYLLNAKRCAAEPWSIDTETGHQLLATRCLEILNSQLKFNICSLEDSHLSNAEVPDIDDLVALNVSTHLKYASCSWYKHVENSLGDTTTTVLNLMRIFSNHQFLYWLEVLSLLVEVPIATDALCAGITYAKQGRDEDLAAFLTDCLKFVETFAKLIGHSAPHIYLSALPFSPKKSGINVQFGHLFPNTLQIGGTLEDWPPTRPLFRGHESVVVTVNFSPDGLRIVSGSDDRTLCIWDARNGALVGAPLEGHTSVVNSVNFSPDGMRIVSGSRDKTLRIWNAQTGAAIGAPLEGHTDEVTSVTFSPDNLKIASGSWDNKIRIWDAQTGAVIGGILEGHTDAVMTVHFSPDSRRIVSGSVDTTLRIWDVETAAPLGETMTGHTDWVASVNFSPDDLRIVSGSHDGTLRIWNSQTGAPIGEPLTGHTGWVTSVNFSPDSRIIVSGSSDSTVRLWDAKNVNFSPDGRTVVSGSREMTLRIWDVRLDELDGTPISDSDDLSTTPTSYDSPTPVADHPIGLPVFNTTFEGDWALDTAGKPMFSVPPWRRDGLYSPRNTLVICAAGTTTLNLDRFVHGTEWQKCIDPNTVCESLVPASDHDHNALTNKVWPCSESAKLAFEIPNINTVAFTTSYVSPHELVPVAASVSVIIGLCPIPIM